MSSDDKDLMNEVASIIDAAAENMSKDKEAEMRSVIEVLATKAKEDNLIPQGDQVLMYFIGQTPIDEVDPDQAVRTMTTEGKTIEQLRQEGYTGGRVARPYTFDTYDDCLDNLGSAVAGILADWSQGQRSWASVTCFKEQGTTTYIMVASNCVTIHKVLATGDTLTAFHDPDTSSTKAVEDNLYTQGKRIVEAQYRFTVAPQTMRHQYPNTYKAMLEQALKRLGEDNNGETTE